MSYLLANDLQVARARIPMSRVGAWGADLDVIADDALAFTGAVELRSEDGVLELNGTVWTPPGGAARAGLTGSGRVRVRVVGGAGGLGVRCPAAAWTFAPLLLPLTAVLAAGGEMASSTIAAGVLDFHFPRWTLQAGTEVRAAIAMLAARAGVIWRVLPDGSIWLGTDAFAVVAPEHHVIRELPEQARIIVEPRSGEPAVMPGSTFLGRPVSYVVHQVDGHGLRSDVTFEAATERLRDAFKRLARGAVPDLDFSKVYGARVIAQNADGTLELQPDALERDGVDVSMAPVSRVPIHYMLPGMSAMVRPGARCDLEFQNSDERRPFVRTWESGDLISLTIQSRDAISLGGNDAWDPLTEAGRYVRYGDKIAFPVGVAGTPTSMTVTGVAVPPPVGAFVSRLRGA
jgi:hypothetical protein